MGHIKKRNLYTPTINIHAHNFASSFSGAEGDLGTLIGGWGENEDYFVPMGNLIGGPLFNYYMQRTQETPVEEEWAMFNKIIDHMHDMDDGLLLRTFEEELQDRSARYKNIFDIALERFFVGQFQRFYEIVLESYTAAEAYKMGYYLSHKDGHYIRITKDNIFDHTIEALDLALESTTYNSNSKV